MEKIVTIRFTGLTPLIQHSERLANPLDEEKQKLSALTHEKKKTPDHLWKIARLEWELGQYRDAQGPIMPTANVRKAIIEGARLSKAGKDIERGLVPQFGSAVLEYEGPRDLSAMWSLKNKFLDLRTVVQARQRILRARPIFIEWAFTVPFQIETEILPADKLLAFTKTAGRFIGLGDMRVGKGGTYGRFRAEAKPE